MPQRITVRFIREADFRGIKVPQIIYRIDKNGLPPYNMVEVLISDEDAGDEELFRQSYTKDAHQINGTLKGEKIIQHLGHLLRINLIVDGHEEESISVFSGERVRISQRIEIDRSKKVIRCTLLNLSQSEDITFSQGDISMLLSNNDGTQTLLPFPAFELIRNGRHSFILPIDSRISRGELRTNQDVCARYEIQ